MNFPSKSIISKPIIAVFALAFFSWLARVVFAQTNNAPIDKTTVEDVFRYAGWFMFILAILTIAAAAVYNTLRKAALTEAKELAATRKEKLIEKELENERLRSYVRDLEKENESLEKKNLRLQGPPNS